MTYDEIRMALNATTNCTCTTVKAHAKCNEVCTTAVVTLGTLRDDIFTASTASAL